jgi:putative pyruvate formate lyase activating enzyme
VPQILAALPVAIKRGLNVPLVYNSSGYETLETLQLLDGIIDIYMPDFKFWKSESARLYMNAPDYPERTRMAIQEMHRQVGDLCLDKKGLAQRGLLIRHLVMPGMLDETEGILNFIAREISSDSYVNLMDQYHPCGDAGNFLTSIDLSPLRSINRRWRMQAMPESPDLTKEIFRIYYNVYT